MNSNRICSTTILISGDVSLPRFLIRYQVKTNFQSFEYNGHKYDISYKYLRAISSEKLIPS